jgi:transposase-like protein
VQWQDEYEAWKQRRLDGLEVVYLWADGLYVKAGLEDTRAALLVMVGVLTNGRKVVLAVESGQRESKESWGMILRDLRKRGLKPWRCTIADGHLGLWAVLGEQYPTSAEQRCWNQRIINILDAMPKKYQAEAPLTFRAEHAKPVVDAFFAWLTRTLREQVLLPTNPFTEAAHDALEREAALRVFLEYPTVPLDTNHLEREIRAIALGRKHWNFCWTELGARYVGVAQSLRASCRPQGVDPYVYLVDVLQRIDTHPAFDVHLLTPRLWKQHFADNPLRSDLDRPRQ